MTYPEDERHLLVLAGPGSGKTWTIVERIRHLLDNGLADPEQILAMTFTRRAAEELRERLGHAGVWAGTFHGVCADLLRQHGAAIGLPSPFRIYDEQRQQDALIRAASEAGYVLEERGDLTLRDVRSAISSRKRRGLNIGDTHAFDPARADLLAQIDEGYCRLLREVGALDYDDLIVNGVNVLEADPDAADSERRRLRFIFIDEFHDVSPEQFRLIWLLAPPRMPGRQVMVVADEQQAIYGWRDGDARWMLDRYRREYRPRVFELRRNYRSAGNIVRAAGALMDGHGAPIRSEPVEPDNVVIACCGFRDLENEAEALARTIQRACNGSKHGYGDIAVLYRTHKRADSAEAALLQHGIPTWRVQQNRFFNQPDVHEALRYLELVVALHDDSFEPALNWPRVLVDELTMIHLRRLARSEDCSLCDLARRIDGYADRVSPLTRAAILAFLDTVDVELAPLVNQPIAEVIERLLLLLARRRSPIPTAERETLHGVLDFLGRPLEAAVDALLAAVRGGRAVVLLADDNLDCAVGAAILEHVLGHYLRHPVRTLGPGDQAAPGQFVIRLGEALEARADGVGLGVRRLRAMAYSVGTQAWRLGQMLLMRYETLHNGRFVVIDLETGSKHPNQADIVEIGAISLRTRRQDGDGFQTLVRPAERQSLTVRASEVHSITWDDVQEAPTIDNVLPSFLAMVDGATLVGHNIEDFDFPILRRVAHQAGVALPELHLVDTWKLACRLLPDAAGHRLWDLAEHFDLRRSDERQPHRALPDARYNADVFTALLDVQRREQELDALTEALPLVALSIKAANVPEVDENATLALAGARARRMGQGARLWERLVEVAGGAQELSDAEAWLATFPHEVPDDDARWEQHARQWRDAVENFCGGSANHSLDAFLHFAALATSIDVVPADDGANDAGDPRRRARIERVAMMTIHSAKGKEWPVVFLLGAEDDQIPLWNAKDADEERRVLYVGMTRAMQRLFILWARQTGERKNQLSRFLAALPAELIDRRE